MLAKLLVNLTKEVFMLTRLLVNLTRSAILTKLLGLTSILPTDLDRSLGHLGGILGPLGAMVNILGPLKAILGAS